jgi:uncharacterized protein
MSVKVLRPLRTQVWRGHFFCDKIKAMKKKIVVLYHANCPDGFGAAWVAWRKFKNKAEYIPIQPRELPDGKFAGKDIYVLDNSFSAAVQKELRRKNKKVVVIDHHESAREDVLAFPENVFSGNKNSGSVLTWRYFNPGRPVPKLLKYVEDIDLWAFKLPNSDEIASFIFGNNFDFERWNKFYRDLETAAGRKKYAAAGGIISGYMEVITDEIVGKAYPVSFLGHKVLAANFSSKRFHSQIGHALCRKKPPMGVVWYVSAGELNVSLRSEGNFDVSKVARRFPEGGGHKHAAGFTIPFNGKFPWKVIKQK